MERINFDSGVKEFKINGGGVLRFNPGDPNVYARFLEAAEKIRDVEAALTQQAKDIPQEDSGKAAVKLMAEADKQMKQILGWVFGPANDFDKLLGGVNLLAVAGNGERVVTNLFAALQPILVEGAQCCAAEKRQEAMRKANARRASQSK